MRQRSDLSLNYTTSEWQCPHHSMFRWLWTTRFDRGGGGEGVKKVWWSIWWHHNQAGLCEWGDRKCTHHQHEHKIGLLKRVRSTGTALVWRFDPCTYQIHTHICKQIHWESTHCLFLGIPSKVYANIFICTSTSFEAEKLFLLCRQLKR